MKKPVFLVILLFVAVTLMSQDILLTFTGTGESAVIDSITATNLSTNESITLPGNETLVLSLNTGILLIEELTHSGLVFPNPFSGKATLLVSIQKPQTVYLKVQNLIGHMVAQTTALVQPGKNEFALNIAAAGIYFISLTSDQGTVGYKVICTGVTELGNRIQYKGALSNYNQNPSRLANKSVQTAYTLRYSTGDLIQYICYSDVMTTVATDIPNTSKNYEVEFSYCTDPDKKNYKIVKIGEQTWMAENLAYLPTVSPGFVTSDSQPTFYVNYYSLWSVSEAKQQINYATYGVLYNWPAAMTSCPDGWHLPSDEEWKTLEKFLGMSSSDTEVEGWRNSGDVGQKLKSTDGWTDNCNGNNSSGFFAVPGGDLHHNWGFGDLGRNAYFWSSSEHDPLRDSLHAWYRELYYQFNGVARYSGYLRREGFSVRCLKNS